jgi:hypothetical protein
MTDWNRVPFLALARTFTQIQQTRARLQQIDILKDYFVAVAATSPSDVLPSILLATNQVKNKMDRSIVPNIHIHIHLHIHTHSLSLTIHTFSLVNVD